MMDKLMVENANLRIALQSLVISCTPICSHDPNLDAPGVCFPDRSILKAARELLRRIGT